MMYKTRQKGVSLENCWHALALFGLGILGACSAPQQPDAKSHGIETPLQKESGKGGGAAAGRPQPQLDLAAFEPLLAAPELVAIRQAVVDERYEDAASRYAEVVAIARKHGTASPEQLFQLARLESLAAHPKEALASFAESAAQNWALTDYARVFAGREALRAGAARRALGFLTNVPNDLPVTDRAHLLEAEALLAIGDLKKAIVLLERLAAREPELNTWPRVHLLLAKALLRRHAAVKQSGPTTQTPAASVGIADKEALLGLSRALRYVRHVSLRLPGRASGKRALALEQQILAKLPPKEFDRRQALNLDDQLVRLNALVDSRQFADARAASKELLAAPSTERFSALRCEALYLRAKALAGNKKWGQAADLVADATRRCKDAKLHAKLLFLAGKYSQFDKRYSNAVRYFARLEKDAAENTLADDARLRRAHCYLELGDESRFTQLLSTMAADYPSGDMVLDGVFELALRHIGRGEWATASNVLAGALAVATKADRKRDHEYAGRERYFLARAYIETGEEERGYAEYEKLIRERPLSYYMQHAYSRLLAKFPERAKAAKAAAIALAKEQPFTFEHQSSFDSLSFQRGLALMRLGELDYAEKELAAEGGYDPGIIWSVVLLYSRGGATSLAHKLVRGKLTDWLSRWPVGEWEKAWHIAFPRPYLKHVQKGAAKHELPESLIYAVMREESGFEAKVVSHAKAYGLMQLIRPTAKHFAKKEGLPSSERALKQPRINIALGSRALRSFQNRFPHNPLLAVPGYNAGPGRPRRWLRERPNLDFDVWVELIPFRETRRYTKRVLASRGVYAFLYSDPLLGDALLPIKMHEKP